MNIGETTRHDAPRNARLEPPDNYSRDSSTRLIIVKRSAWNEMWEHSIEGARERCEVLGYLIGLPLEDPDTHISATYIEKAIRGVYRSTATSVASSPESFFAVDEACKEHSMILVGYYHSHPDLEVFQSSVDKHNFTSFYSAPYNVAPVLAPRRIDSVAPSEYDQRTGFFCWNNAGIPVRASKENVVFVDNPSNFLPSSLPAVNESIATNTLDMASPSPQSRLTLFQRLLGRKPRS